MGMGGDLPMHADANAIDWLLAGDVSIQYQTKRDLLDCPQCELETLQLSIADKGWGKELLNRRDNMTGLWGNGIYTPKWISTHYTLLDLKNIGIHPSNAPYRESSAILLENIWKNHGRAVKSRQPDVCVCAMVAGICSYAALDSQSIHEILDYLLDRQYPDGGWNCRWDSGDKHSSLHTTLSVLEAFRDYQKAHDSYRSEEIKISIPKANEFILKKKLYQSVRSGQVIDRKMLMLSFPCRWRYDILRCLDYFQTIDQEYDERMEDALGILLMKRKTNGRWPLQQKYTGLVHFDMEKPGRDSAWNTLRALRVLKKYRRPSPRLFQNNRKISPSHHVLPVRNEQHGLAPADLPYGLEYLRFAVLVKCGGHLIQQQYRSILDQSAGNGDALLLPARQVIAVVQ
jgi:hypothetical protein